MSNTEHDFGQYRNVELSAMYYLKTLINADWTGVNTILGYPNSPKAKLPIVSITVSNDLPERYEIGNRNLEYVYNIIYDVFGTSKPNVLDLAQYVQNKVKEDFTYYTHSKNSGDNTTLVRANAGTLQWLEFTQSGALEPFENVKSIDRFRHILATNVVLTTT